MRLKITIHSCNVLFLYVDTFLIITLPIFLLSLHMHVWIWAYFVQFSSLLALNLL